MTRYGKVLAQLLPPGKATEGQNLRGLCLRLGAEFDRARAALIGVLAEMPGNLEANLDDWERVLRINPRPGHSVEERNARILAKLSPLRSHSLGSYLAFIERTVGHRPAIAFMPLMKSGFRSGARCYGTKWLSVIIVVGLPLEKQQLAGELLRPYLQSHTILIMRSHDDKG